MITDNGNVLTADERKAVEAFLAAAEALPDSICIDVDDMGFDDEPHLLVRKRTAAGVATKVGELTKSSLVF